MCQELQYCKIKRYCHFQVSYHRNEPSEIEYQCEMPIVPPPEEVPSLEEKFKEYLRYIVCTQDNRFSKIHCSAYVVT